MLSFLTANWFWILFLAGMLFMHSSHRGHGGHGGGGGCGGGHADQHEPTQHELSQSDDATSSDAAPAPISLSKSGHATAPQGAPDLNPQHHITAHPATSRQVPS